MLLSYLVTTHNETDCLDALLSKLISFKKDNHEVVLLDDYSDNPTTISIIEKYKSSINFQQKKLQNDYGVYVKVNGYFKSTRMNYQPMFFLKI